MSQKEKICNTALTSHIEECHEQCTYTPLVVSKDLIVAKPIEEGLLAIMESEVQEKLKPELEKIDAEHQELKKSFRKNIDKALIKSKEELKKFDDHVLINDLDPQVFDLVDGQLDKLQEDSRAKAKNELIAANDLALFQSNPTALIEKREKSIENEFIIDREIPDLSDIQAIKMCEYDGLGIFTSDSICQRKEGKVYDVCGEETTLLPGQSINETNAIKISSEESESSDINTDESLSQRDNISEVESFSRSYENKLKKEKDIKYATESSFNGSLSFGVGKLKLGLTNNVSIGWNQVVEMINKSSFETTKKRFQEVIRSFKVSKTFKTENSRKFSNEITYKRKWENTTDKPEIYMTRKSYCKTSVLHKRHNIQLAWSGCLENPAKDLCTPDNIEEKYAREIQAIRDKWNSSPAPVDCGPRPAGRKMCTEIYSGFNHPLHIGPSIFNQQFQASIPSGWSYENNSASIKINQHSSAVLNKLIWQQPAGGDRGGVAFTAEVTLDNRYVRRESISFGVCFNTISDEAVEWDKKVEKYRQEEAQKEIDEFLSGKLAELNEFLLSDQAKALIEKKIMEKYFGVQNVDDCCHLIARLRNLFDFDRMCYSLLPTWNEYGEGCQKNNPVTLFTAKCLHFYLPMYEGREFEAVQLLVSINAIPWNGNLATQIFAYINQIQTMRATLFNRVFDPTGWDVKTDQPLGYEMTPYDTVDPNWKTAYESDLNYQLIGAYTINIPCGERTEKRPLLCE